MLGVFLVFSSGYAGYPMLALLAIILGELVTRRLAWVSTSFDRPLLALLAVSLASALVSPWRSQALIPVSLFVLTAVVSVYPAARVIRAWPEAIRPMFGVWVAGALFAAAWGILRAPAAWPSGASTPTLGSTALGTTMAAAVVVAMGAWTTWDQPWVRIGLAGGLPVLVTALALTTSRAAWIAAAVGAGVMIGLAPRRRAALVILCVASVAVAMLATRVERQSLAQRLESIPSVEANADRLAIWSGAVRMVRDHPLLGTGYGTFIFAWSQYSRDPTLMDKPTAHNVFLNFAAETGLLGLAAFLAVVLGGLAGLWRRVRSSKSDPKTDGLWAALFAAVVAMLIQQLFDATVMSLHIGYGLLAAFALGGTQLSGAAAPTSKTPA